jgi:hypothetical protein
VGKSEHKKEKDWYRGHEHRKRQRNSGQPPFRALTAHVYAIRDELYAQRRQHNHHENKRARREKVGIGAAIIAAALAGLSAWIFQGQLSEMRDEQRPWVYAPTINISGSIIHDKRGMHIPVAFVMKNVGKTPALHAWFSFKVFLAQTRQTDVFAACAFAENATVSSTVFPDDTVRGGVEGEIPQTDIDSVKMKRDQDNIQAEYMIGPVVFGCLAYKIPGDSSFHTTPYQFMLVMARDEDRGKWNKIMEQPVLGLGSVVLMPLQFDLPPAD